MRMRPDYATKYPALAKRRQGLSPSSASDFSRVLLGHDPQGKPVLLEERPRLEHTHIIGSTGSGKTTLMVSLAMQDFRRGAGGILIDPHGSHPDSLFNQVLSQLYLDGFFRTGRVHILDPNLRRHILPINTLARLGDTEFSVIADALLQAFARAWKDEDLHQKPSIRTVLKAIFIALVELCLPLTDGPLFVDPHDRHGVRARAIATLKNEYAREHLTRLHQMALDERSKRDFRAETIGPINRLAEFTSCEVISAMLGVVDEPGLPRRTFDLLGLLERGDILLCNLQHGEAASEADTDLLGAIVLRYLFLLASRRRNREPFFLYVDECHRFLTGDVASILAESRKYGLAAVLAHQFTAQLGKPEDLIFQALLNSTEIKAVFRVKSPAEAQHLAELVMPLSLERPVKASMRATAVGQRRVALQSSSTSRSHATSEGVAETEGEMHAASSMRSRSEGVGRMTSSSIGDGSFDGSTDSSGLLLTPPYQLFGPNHPSATMMMPMPLSQSTGNALSRGASQQSATASGESSMNVDSHGEAETHARSSARTRSATVSAGTSDTTGESEGFETVYADLPASFHSKENELYFAGEMIRALPVGQAFVAWRGKTHHITIPAPRGSHER